MKLLFIVGNLDKQNDANLNITKIIAKELSNRGYTISFLGKSNSELLDNYSNEPLFTFHCIKYQNTKKREKKRLFLKITDYLLNKYYFRNLVNSYAKTLRNLNEYNRYDVIISVSYPYFTSLVLAKSKINTVKIVYQLDPHFSHYKNKYVKSKLAEEKFVYSNVDAVILTKLLYDENSTNLLSSYTNKMLRLDFPNIRKIDNNTHDNSVAFSQSRINCLFVGNLYDDIRNPEFVLASFLKLSKDYVLHFIGGGSIDKLIQYQSKLGDRLVYHGVVDYSTAISSISKADILINIGNSIANQVPSKIYDYISSCKPIINFIKISNCPSVKILINYPSVLNIFEYEDSLEQSTEKIKYFYEKSTRNKIDYSIIEKKYYENSAEYVTSILVKFIEKLKQEKMHIYEN